MAQQNPDVELLKSYAKTMEELESCINRLRGERELFVAIAKAMAEENFWTEFVVSGTDLDVKGRQQSNNMRATAEELATLRDLIGQAHSLLHDKRGLDSQLETTEYRHLIKPNPTLESNSLEWWDL